MRISLSTVWFVAILLVSLPTFVQGKEKLTRDQVIEIVRKAQDTRTGTWRGRAELSGFDLSGLDLSGVDLRGANLARVNLRGANLSNANLRFRPREFPRVILVGADLTEANLSKADLSGANLARATLRKANLRGAFLRKAGDRPVHETNLAHADLTGANLRNADLSGANLFQANLTDADLINAIFTGGVLNNSRLWRAQLSDEAWQLYTPPFISSLIREAKTLVRQGQVQKAILLYEIAQKKVQEHDPPLSIQAGSWNNLCWHGSLHEHAAEVMDACERAVELDRENGAHRDSRGLARALTGDIQGAIEDFEYYVAWGPNHGRSEKSVRTRQEWIQQLRENQNPFDRVTLEELR